MKQLKHLSKTFVLAVAMISATISAKAADQYTLARWSFNYKYTVSNGVGTPSSTEQTSNDDVNLHDVKLVPNEQLVGNAYLIPHRPTSDNTENAVASQDKKGAYLETKSISCDGAALHLTSPVPTPEAASSSYTYGTSTADFPDGNAYSYQNPYNYFEIELTTADYKNIQLMIKAAGHKSSAQYYAVAYSTDRTTWTVVGDTYLTGSSYNKWTSNTISLADLGGKEKAYIRIFPADNWKGSNDNVNSDNQFDLDDVYVYGELDGNLAEITGFNVNGEAASASDDASFDYDYLLAKDYSGANVVITPLVSCATVKASATDQDGNSQTVTDNGDGTFTINTPNANGYYLVTFTLTAQSGAITQKESYTVRVFHLGEIKLTDVQINGTSISSSLLNTLNESGSATSSDKIFTKMPTVTASVIDKSAATITSTQSGSDVIFTIEARDKSYVLTVSGVHIYNKGENDEDIILQYSADGKAAYVADGDWSEGWTDGLYTLRTKSLDGWGGAQFKFNSSDFKIEVPGGVVVKTFSLERFGANYGNGDGLTAFSAGDATCWVPSDHAYVQGGQDTIIVVLDNHTAGEPFTFSITGGNQPYAQIHLVIEKTNPGTAPTVTSQSVKTENNHAMVSISFDREMTSTSVSFNGSEIYAEGGTTLTFGLTDLQYDTDYTFTIPAGTVVDLFGNKTAEDITVSFHIDAQKAVEKKTFDYVVGTTDELSAALKALGSSKSTSLERKIIFIKKGDYDFGEDNEQRINRGNVSLVGQYRDSVLIHGTRTGISNPIINIRDREGFYLQDLTIRNDLDFGTTRKGVGVALYGGNKSMFKNICLQSQQDTQVTGERSYYDKCTIQGTVDFICGGGNHFYDQCDIVLEGSGSVIAAPATVATAKYGYVFSHCTISANPKTSISNGDYTLARPWQNEPRTYYLYTTMNVLPSNNGYRGMSSLPTHFYEYGSMDKNGNTIDLSVRGNSSTSTNHYTPVLTESEAKAFTVMNVLSETDGWLPTDYTKLTEAPKASVEGGVISWEDDSQARCYVIFKDDNYVTNITETSYAPEETGTYQIRSANQMGGLSESITEVTVTVTGINNISVDAKADNNVTYNLAGQKVDRNYKGIVVKGGKKYLMK